MRITYSYDGIGNLHLSKPEYDTLPKEAKARLKALAIKRASENNLGFEFSFYGGGSLDLALEVCRFYHLTLESYRQRDFVIE